MKKKIMTIMIAALVIGSVSLFAITNQEAENIALESAGVDRNSITNIFSRTDWEDGVRVYDVTFFDADGKYEYSIGADDGLVYGFDYEKNMRRVSTPSSSPVSRDEALSIALVEASQKPTSQGRGLSMTVMTAWRSMRLSSGAGIMNTAMT